MAADGNMWRQVQMGRANPAAWERSADNHCLGCGRKSTPTDYVWTWGTGRHASASPRGIYCLRCGPPAGEPQGADIAAAARRSSGAGA